MPPRRLADTQAPGSFAQDKDALEDILLLPISITPTSASSPTRMGIAYSLFLEAFPGKPRWSVEEISDLTGQVVIVTGGNSGIGIEMCKVLLSKGAKVYMTARSREKADEAIEWLRTETRGKSPVFLELDLADLNSVRRAVGEFKKNEQDLHVLYNNAGIMLPSVELKTANGYDLQFGTNVLGHYLFTTLLLPLLIHTARTSQLANGVARVVNTSSTMQWMAPRGGINYATLVPNSPEANEVCIKMGTGALHAQSKWGIIAFSNELARRYESQGIISMSLHPGAIANRYNSTMPGIGGWFVGLTLNPTHWGALTPLYGGTSLEGMNLSGKYLIPWGRIGVARSDTYDEKRGQELWSWLEEQVKRF